MKEYILIIVGGTLGALLVIYFIMWLFVFLRVRGTFMKLDLLVKRRLELSKVYIQMIYDSFLQEQAALIAVNDINNKLSGSVSDEEYFDLNARLTDEFRRIFASIPNYPELRSKENFDSIHGELNELESKIDTSRNVYNDRAKRFNFRMSKFPFKIFKAKEKSLYITKYDRFNTN